MKTMTFYIQIKDGQPFQHPYYDWNMKDAFPEVDLNNLPDYLAEFIRVPEPNIEVGMYEVPEVTYQWVGNVVSDVWVARPMTDEERAQKDEQLKYINQINTSTNLI